MASRMTFSAISVGAPARSGFDIRFLKQFIKKRRDSGKDPLVLYKFVFRFLISGIRKLSQNVCVCISRFFFRYQKVFLSGKLCFLQHKKRKHFICLCTEKFNLFHEFYRFLSSQV